MHAERHALVRRHRPLARGRDRLAGHVHIVVLINVGTRAAAVESLEAVAEIVEVQADVAGADLNADAA